MNGAPPVAASPATRPLTASPRLGFLGTGWIGRHRLEALARSGAGTVAAIAEPVAENARAAHAVAPDAAIVANLDSLLGMELDGIVIATPSALHAEQAVHAFEHGLAVFCQKPLACTAADTRRVLDAARAADRPLGIDLSYRWTEAMRCVRDAVRSGATGDVFAVDVVFHNAYGPNPGWARDPALAGGGCVMDLGIHLVDLAFWVLDSPRVASVRAQLHAQGQRLAPGTNVCEDHALATIEVETGAVIRLACSWEARTGYGAVIEATFRGDRATASMRNVDGSFYDFAAVLAAGTASTVLSSPPDEWGGRALVEWSGRLARDPRYDPAVETILGVAETLDAVLGR